jgi:hypothetical protein
MATSFDYLGIPGLAPTGKKTSKKSTTPAPSVPVDIDAASGLIRYSPEWQRFQDQRDMAMASRAAGITNATIENPTGTPTSTPTTSASIGGGIPNVPPPPSGDNISAQTKDAFAIMQEALTSWGLESLGKNFQTLMVQGYTAGEALIKIKTDKAYNAEYVARFAGNFQRQDKGLNVMSEAAYLALENSMESSLVNRGYGNILSANPETRRQQKAGWIGNNWNATDFEVALKTIEERVDTQDPMILAKMQQYYPGLQKKDLVTYLLDPTNKETMSSLNKKVTAGEIGAALSGQGLMEDVNRVQGLVNAGVSGATALAQAGNIKAVLPYSQDLTNVYKEAGIVYNQDTAEQEFFKGNVDAQKKRNQLKSLQRASFQADPGMGKGALSSPISI